MRKLLLVALLACFTSPQVIKAQSLMATYGMLTKKNIKISNSHRTLYVDGIVRGLQKKGKKVDGEVVIGNDKNGIVWIANMSEYRLDVNYSWGVAGGMNATVVLDPWEISRLKDKKGEYFPTNYKILGMPWIRGH